MKTKVVMVGLLLISVLLAWGNSVIGAPAVSLTSVYIEEALPTTDPNSSLWDRAVASEIPLSGQTVQTPMRFRPFAENILVTSLNNGSEIAFLIEWADSTKDERTVKTEEFRDAVAVQFVGPSYYICMGAVDRRIHILQWKADWQKDIEEGFQDVEHAFPNFWVDYYPYAVGEPPYRIPEAFPEIARVYLAGWNVGNPVSEPLKVTPVEETIALGFGSIATQESQDSIGRGLWQQETWKVVIARKLNTGDANDVELSPTKEHAIAFAVWDGAGGDVGARKSVSAGIALKVESPLWYAGIQPWIPIIIIPVIAVALVLAFLFVRKTKTQSGEQTEYLSQS